MLKLTAVAAITLFALASAPAQALSLSQQASSLYPSREACYRDFGCFQVGETWFCPTPDAFICEDYPPEG